MAGQVVWYLERIDDLKFKFLTRKETDFNIRIFQVNRLKVNLYFGGRIFQHSACSRVLDCNLMVRRVDGPSTIAWSSLWCSFAIVDFCF